MHRLDRLFVLWSRPGPEREGQRYVIGELWRDRAGHSFAYAPDLSAARQAGFTLMAEFPDHRGVDDPYRSGHLFWTFSERIPSPRRPDYKKLMSSWGVQHPDDQFEVLALSGGVQATDRIELAEYRASDDDLSTELLFRLAGERFGEGAADLQAGDSLELRCEPTNPVDPSATQVVFKGARKIGYVPVQYSRTVARLLRTGQALEARAVRRLLLPEERGRWIISARNPTPER